MDLTEYAAAQREHRGPRAWVETLPEWPEILAAYKSGVGLPTIIRWLIDDRGYPPHEVTIGRMQQVYKAHARTRGD